MTLSPYRIDLPWTKTPINANDRHHWRAKARIVADIRRDTHILAKAARLPKGVPHVSVTLHYAPRTNGRRDADNLVVPFFKSLCDGLVDYGLTADDTPAEMTKHMPIIEPKSVTGQGQMWLTITVEEAQ